MSLCFAGSFVEAMPTVDQKDDSPEAQLLRRAAQQQIDANRRPVGGAGVSFVIGADGTVIVDSTKEGVFQLSPEGNQ